MSLFAAGAAFQPRPRAFYIVTRTGGGGAHGESFLSRPAGIVEAAGTCGVTHCGLAENYDLLFHRRTATALSLYKSRKLVEVSD
jgi:hypothetical protein